MKMRQRRKERRRMIKHFERYRHLTLRENAEEVQHTRALGGTIKHGKACRCCCQYGA